MRFQAEAGVLLHVLGAFEVAARSPGGRRAIALTPKNRALLAYLALARPRATARDRDVVAVMFWPEHDRERARANLRKALYELRRALGASVLTSRGRRTIGVRPDAIWCDALELEAALHNDDVEAALELYRGPLLPGAHVEGSAEFDRWLDGERHAIRGRVLDAARRRAAQAEEIGAVAAAARWWERALAIDPYDEATACGLLTARAALGDRTGAVRAFDAFEARLRADLELEPAPETRRIAARLRAGHASPRETGSARREALTEPEFAAAPGADPERAFDPASGRTEAGAHAARRVRGSRRFGRWVPALVAMALVVAALAGSWRFLLAPSNAPDGSAGGAPDVAPGVAVVPFRVADQKLASWSESLVDLLSTSLDGAAGFRSIHSRTVLARWLEAVAEDASPDLQAALDVARRADAAFAVVGSVVSLDTRVRLDAEVYDVAGDSALGRARVDGHPDSLYALVDRLTIGILDALLAGSGRRAPGPRLAAVTSSSLAAVRAYLRGEQLYRQADFESAARAYREAVETDSTFALAWYRLGQAYSWSTGNAAEAMARAVRNADRLPLREGLLLRAHHALTTGAAERAEGLLREAVKRYPDDAEAWYLLGDLYIHFGGPLLADPLSADTALARARDLEPTFPPYRLHLVDRAFNTADSATTARVMAEYLRLDSRSATAAAYRLAHALAFGDAPTRRRAWAGVDTIPTVSLRPAHLQLGHARLLARRERLLRRTLGRPDLDLRRFTAEQLAWTLERSGRLREAAAQLRDSLVRPGTRARLVYRLVTIGGLDAGADLRRVLDLDAVLNRPDGGTTHDGLLFYAGAFALEEGRWRDHGAAVEALRTAALRAVPEDSALARVLEGQALALEGYGLGRRGQVADALARLGPARPMTTAWGSAGGPNATIRWWTAALLANAGRDAEAARHLESLARFSDMGSGGFDPYASWELGRIHERAGAWQEAARAYVVPLTAWHGADPELRPRIRAARRTLAE